MDNEQLSQRIIKLATEMFAGQTGFSGPELHDVFADYTDDLGSYAWSGGSPSRWQLFDKGLASLPPATQRQLLLDLCEHQGRMKHGPPGEEQVAKLRGWLLSDTAPGAIAAAEKLSSMADWGAVQKSWNVALTKVTDDPESAITAARATLESVCKHICDERNVLYEPGWDLTRLYKATCTGLGLAPDQHTEQVIKQILGGVVTVVSGLAALRNALSDAHGKGKLAARPAPRHAKFAVNASFAVAGFLIDTHVERRGTAPST